MALLSCGSNAFGQLGNGTTVDSHSPLLSLSTLEAPYTYSANATTKTLHPILTCPKSISCGSNHSAIVLQDGALLTCGRNHRGQLGFETTSQMLDDVHSGKEVGAMEHAGEICLTAFRPLNLTANGSSVKFVSVACGWDFTVAVDNDGMVWSFGENSKGQLGRKVKEDGNGVPHHQPQRVHGLHGVKVVKVSVGLTHCLALCDSGEIWGWGDGRSGGLGPIDQLDLVASSSPSKQGNGTRRSTTPAIVNAQKLRVLPSSEVFVDMACGRNHSIFVTLTGSVYTLGRNKRLQLGFADAAASDHVVLHKVNLFPLCGSIDNTEDAPVNAMSGWTHSGVRTRSGRVFVWGRCDRFQLGDGTPCIENAVARESCLPVEMVSLRGCRRVAFSSESGMALLEDEKTCVSWGWNEHGNCGVGLKLEGDVREPHAVAAWVMWRDANDEGHDEVHSAPFGCGCGHAFLFGRPISI
ncbi:regulator of chromosome condensation 1/beta-lactamase-inhibitor protein II [Chytridium lagenaria]|nr:regulator of chromosome condensation 1/beta-lactamase-inhibitor protein II [Chytridium lagenaria]